MLGDPDTPGAGLTASQVRQVTRAVQGARLGREPVLLEVWAGLLTVVVLGAVLVGAARATGAALGWPTLPGAGGVWSAALAQAAVGGAVLGVASRLGPVGSSAAAAAWWLPLPVDRGALLRPAALGPLAASAGVGLASAPLLLLLSGAPTAIPGLVLAALAGSATHVALVGVAAAAQRRGPTAARRSARAGDLVLVAGLLGCVAVVGERDAATTAPGRVPVWAWAALAGVVVAAVAIGVDVLRRVGRLPTQDLRRSGGLGERSVMAVLSLDLRELGAALDATSLRLPGRAWRRWPRHPAASLVVADALLLARRGDLLLRAAVAAGLGVVVLHHPAGQTPWLLWALLVLSGYLAASAAGAGARAAEAVPGTGRLLPLGERLGRLAHGTVPLVVALLWASVVAIGSEVGDGRTLPATGPAGGVLLAVSWAVTLAAAVVRSAWRTAPSYRTAALVTPMGGVPQTGGLFQGLDVAVWGTLPTAIGLVVGRLDGPVLAAQVVATAVSVALVVALTAPKPLPQPPGSRSVGSGPATG